MAKREIEGVFSSVKFSKEKNEEINKKMNTWTKKELVQVIYELGNRLDKNVLGTTDITKALESFDDILKYMRVWHERNEKAGKCLDKWKTYRKNLLLYGVKLRMKKDGTRYLENERGTIEEFAREYEQQIFKKLKEEGIVNIKVKDPAGYIVKQRYNVKKPKEPSCCYKSIGEIPYSDAALPESGLESCTKASLKNLLEVMIESDPELLPLRIDIEIVFATRSNHKGGVYYMSQESYDAVKEECAERVRCIEQMQKRCQKLEAMIEKKINSDL
jgi:hypothetical protein